MSISIQTNVASLNAQRSLFGTQRMLERTMSHLSSGYRITTAADDAAGLGVSTNLIAQIRSLNQAVRNANDGISVVQTAEGALNEVHNMLIRMRELAMQGSSDGISDTERAYLDTEFQALDDEINRIAGTTEFNGQNLLDGTFAVTGLDFQVGIRDSASNRITVTVADSQSAALGIDALAVGTKAGSQAALAAIDTAIGTVSSTRASLGAFGNRLNSVVTNLQVASENLAAANSRIRDVNVAEETAMLSKSQILMQAGVAVLAQANALPSVALSLLRG